MYARATRCPGQNAWLLLFSVLALATAACPIGLWAGEGTSAPRIISLYAADTEILLRLGARDALVGISRQETYQGQETQGWERPPEFSIHD
ncbi:MAG: hypothetical protein LBL95_01145, partial [Deltaproteobacteria bacterium]|nr:hypothetical protein [Deltaproteobacteria bacterium]